VFKRRKPRTYWESFVEAFFPRAGWARVISYFGHRIKRLPDSPHKIAIGFACGVFISFTPLFGFHFVSAMALAYFFRGNLVASLLGTWVGNPLTFPFIATTSYQLGLRLLGMNSSETVWHKLKHSFSEAADTVWTNFMSLFGSAPSPWAGFSQFFHDIFLPYLVGGIVPGIICGIIFYYIVRPIVAAYQHRRKGQLLAKFKELKSKHKATADEPKESR
jgi:uncharacterized protein (DUF2062 family)